MPNTSLDPIANLSRRGRRAVLAAGALLAATAGPSLAQNIPGVTHSVGVYAGTCDGFDQQPLQQLSDATIRDDNDDDDDDDGAAAASFVGGGGVIPVAISVTEVAGQLDNFVGQPHVVVVSGTGSDAGAALACGQIGGALFDDEVLFGLRDLSGAGQSGIAIVGDDDDDGDVEFRVYVASPGATGQAADGAGIPAVGGVADDDDDGDDGIAVDAAGSAGVPAVGGDDDDGVGDD